MRRAISVLAGAALLLSSCGGGGGSGTSQPGTLGPGSTTGSVFQVPDTSVNLTVADIQKVIAQGVAEARAQNRPSGFVVIDRVGNVLAVFAMDGADLSLRIPPAPNGNNLDLQNLQLPAPAALVGGISKALTSSYFSSVGGAFSSRTANDIVQETFPESQTTRGLESGALFSVQFSQLPCSDISRRFGPGGTTEVGPKRGPLGVGADPGAFPLYKNGAVVGSVAVVGDGIYGYDTEYRGKDANNTDEVIALAATTGFEPRDEIRADRISIDGTLLRWSDATTADFRSNPASAPGYASIDGPVGRLVSVAGYFDAAGGIVAGSRYGQRESGVIPDTSAVDPQYSDSDIWIVNDNTGRNRYPPRAGTDGTAVGTPLTANEVKTILVEAFDVQRRARAQVRRPLDNRAQNTIVVVDTFGEVLGLVRGPDALVDAIDAVPQKARTTAFFSNPQAAADLNGNPDAEVRSYVQKFRNFIGLPNALTGDIAWSLRSIGNLARPFYPDGQVGTPAGPLSQPDGQFSIFATGLQSRLITPDIVAHVNFILGASPTDVPRTCGRSPDVRPGYNRINNGLTLFAGGVPIYRGGQLVGAVASSGDGDDQSDMIAFLGLVNASKKLGGSVNVPSTSIRSDTLLPLGNRLTFIACPFAPFVGTSDQNVCQGF